MESSQWENLNHLFCRIVSFLTDPHNSFSIFSVNIISLHQEVRGIFVIKAAVEMQNNLHFVTNGEHLYVFCRQNQPFSRKWWNLNDQSYLILTFRQRFFSKVHAHYRHGTLYLF